MTEAQSITVEALEVYREKYLAKIDAIDRLIAAAKEEDEPVKKAPAAAKPRRKRRTKAEMEAAKGAQV